MGSYAISGTTKGTPVHVIRIFGAILSSDFLFVRLVVEICFAFDSFVSWIQL